MNVAAARLDGETLDLLQHLNPVDLKDFRLLPDCALCMLYAKMPATDMWNVHITEHVVAEHQGMLAKDRPMWWRMPELPGIDLLVD